MVEQRLVKPLVESSNLSSSANGELAERYRTGLLSQGWDNTQVSSILTLSAKNCLLMSEFDDEEIEISQYSSQTNGALAEWIFMHRGEIPDIVVQFHGAPHAGLW